MTKQQAYMMMAFGGVIDLLATIMMALILTGMANVQGPIRGILVIFGGASLLVANAMLFWGILSLSKRK